MKHARGFTLLELMIVLVIISILVGIAIPSYTQYIRRSARSTAETDLMNAVARMERLKAQNFSYTGASVGASNTTVINVSPADGSGPVQYNVSLIGVEANGTTQDAPPLPATSVTYIIQAISTPAFSNNSTEALAIKSDGSKCYLPLTSGSVTACFGASGAQSTWPTR